MPSNITPFASSPRAPFPVGSVPESGWFPVEPACEWAVRNEEELRNALGISIPKNREQMTPHKASLTPEDLVILADNFDLAETTGGRGLLVTKDHSLCSWDQSSKAYGWIKALHAEGNMLWAWIEWTPEGRTEVNNGAYVFNSTEYNYEDFEQRGDGTVVPRRLAALAITNDPNHTLQPGMTNKADRAARETNTKTMKTRGKTAMTTQSRRQTNSASEQEKQQNPTPPETQEEQKDPDTNTDEEQDDKTDCNADGDTAIDLLMQIADALDLDDTANTEDVLAAVNDLVAQNAELTEALAAANAAAGTGGDTNSRRYPNLFRARNAKPLRGGKPNRDVNIRVAGQPRQVNCQAMAQTDYCVKRIAEAEATLGRRLTTSEYSTEMTRAMQDYISGNDR